MSEKPRFLTIRQVAAEGILSEYRLRCMEKAGELPCIYAGVKCLINFDLLVEQLNHLGTSKERGNVHDPE